MVPPAIRPRPEHAGLNSVSALPCFSRSSDPAQGTARKWASIFQREVNPDREGQAGDAGQFRVTATSTPSKTSSQGRYRRGSP